MRREDKGTLRKLLGNIGTIAGSTVVSLGFSLGLTRRPQGVLLTEQDLARHVAILGPTGMGKSKLVEGIALQLIVQGAGLCAVDKDSRTVEELMGHLKEYSEFLNPLRLWDIHFLSPSKERTFSYDPFFTKLSGQEYEFWLDRRVDTVARILGRPHGISDYRQQMRRERVLTDILYMVGTRGRHGRHLGLHRALDALDLGSDRWLRDFNLVCEHMPVEVARDLWRLHRMNARDRLHETESSLNILRAFLSPLVKEMVSGKVPPIDFTEIVRRKGIILASLGETPFFSDEQGNAISAMVINDIVDACWFVNRRYYLLAEEVKRVLGADLGDVLNRARKHELSAILVGTSLSSFKDQYTDIRTDVLSQPGVHILFQQRTDLDEWAELLGTGTLRFDRVWRPMDRPDGHDWHILPEVSVSEGQQATWGDGEDTSCADVEGGMEGEGESQEEGIASTTSRQVSHGKMRGRGFTEVEQHSDSHGTTAPSGGTVLDNRGKKTRTSSVTDSAGFQQSETEQDSESNTDGQSRGLSFKKGVRTTRGSSWSRSQSRGRKHTIGGGSSRQRTIAFRHVPLQRYRTEWYPAGLEEEIPTQYARTKRTLRNLGIAEAMICVMNRKPVVFAVHELPAPFAGFPALAREETKQFIEWTWNQNGYFFVPAECEKWVRRESPSPKPTNGSSNGSTIPVRWARFGFIRKRPPTNGSRNSSSPG